MSDRNPSELILRIPAAVVAIGTPALLLIANTLFLEAPLREGWSTYVVLLVLLAPFVLPWSWFRTRVMRHVLMGWIAVTAVVATSRSIYLLVYFYPRRELGHWLVIQALFFMLVAPLWLALAAAWRRRPQAGC